jgi:hypothetical protein
MGFLVMSFCPEDFNSTSKTLFYLPNFGEGIEQRIILIEIFFYVLN